MDSATRTRRRFRRWAGELNPLRWPAAIRALGREAVRAAVRPPPTPHSYATRRVATPEALDAVMAWLARAQDATGTGGVAAYYALYGGFGRPYPETTGYIIPTMLAYADGRGGPEFEERAVRAADWLLGLQLESGAMPGGFAGPDDGPSVFNTAQILFGLVAAGRRHGGAYLDAAVRAGDWLVEVQDEDGAWRRFTYEGRTHVYYTMVAWALAELWRETGGAAYRSAAEANAHWAMDRRDTSGWFAELNVEPRPGFLHFIAYTLQGLLGCGRTLELPDAVDAVRPAAARLLRRFEIDKRLPGAFERGWTPAGEYACVTGNAQTALVWQGLALADGDLRYLNAALKLNEAVKATIALRGPAGTRGAVKGSDPVWGAYLPLRYPNWAAKFTADALMGEMDALARLRREVRVAGMGGAVDGGGAVDIGGTKGTKGTKSGEGGAAVAGSGP